MARAWGPVIRKRHDEDVTSLEDIPTTTVPPTNDMALVSLLAGVAGWIVAVVTLCPLSQYGGGICFLPLAFIAWTIAILTGFVARGQITATGEGGADIANWGLFSAASGLALGVLALVALTILLLLSIAGLGATIPFIQ